jgi:hypothetical protein
VKSLRRLIAVVATALVLTGSALSAAGCGAGSHYLGGVVAHQAINHFARSPAARRRVNKVFCLYHGHRVLVDLRTHHVFIAGLNALAAWNACKAGFGRHH